MVDVILGLQWGDEGKGKIVDYFAPRYDLIARFQGGPNAGHTLYVKDKKIVLHQIPSGIFHEGVANLIGNGVVLDPVTLKKECEAVAGFGVDYRKNLYISQRAHLILPTHRALDKASEMSKGQEKIGSTLKGIGPAYMDKTGRNGLRVGDLLDKTFTTQYIKLRLKHQKLLDSLNFQEDLSEWEEQFFEALDFMRQFKIVNGEYFINDKLSQGKTVLAEGAQGSMLDVDFGTFPFVTSSNTISAGVCTGLGVAPQRIRDVIGVSKAYCTRVGSGPFPTELEDATGEELRKTGSEIRLHDQWGDQDRDDKGRCSRRFPGSESLHRLFDQRRNDPRNSLPNEPPEDYAGFTDLYGLEHRYHRGKKIRRVAGKHEGIRSVH
jgi:adenylosuccinate synthase